MRLEYVGTDITELSLRKDIPDDAEIELQTNTNYTVYFSEDGDSCYGEFNVEIISQHDPSMLSINYCSKSYFNIYDAYFGEEGDIERQIHMEVFNRIFPMCNETLRQFTSMAGVPNISLLEMNMSDMDIVTEAAPQFSM
ncbi:MAG: hypothetical protein IJA01_02115 [Firmicutes bacterium]|nr:hypothetical protein [Bacillota bacterium]MBQ3611042.1 hypothetical protein [Bacillota bacterium]